MLEVKFNVVIPARYASTRLPGKALLQVHGRPIIQYVYDNAIQSGAEQVIIATDDQRIVDCAEKFNAKVCLTSNQHTSGTDRIAEVTELLNWQDDIIVVNVQGDEPLMPAINIEQVARNLLEHSAVSISTLCTEIINDDERQNSNVVKVVYGKNNLAQCFTRKIDFINQNFSKNIAYRHLGIYAYRVEFLKKFTRLPSSALEIKESLEQLRAFEHGDQIYVEPCKLPTGIGVDTQEDYEALLDIMPSNS